MKDSSTSKRATNLVSVRTIYCALFGTIGSAAYIHFLTPKGILNPPVNFLFFQLRMWLKEAIGKAATAKDFQDLSLIENEFSVYLQYWVVAAICFAFISVFSMVICNHYGLDFSSSKSKEVFHRGSKILGITNFNKLMKKTYHSAGGLMGSALEIGREKVLIPENLQFQHFAFLGASGYGKSTAIEDILVHSRRHLQRCLIVDLGGIYFQKYAEKGDHVLSLTHPASKAWDFKAENGIDHSAISAALIEEKPQSHPFFTKAARELFSALLDLNKNATGILADLEASTSDLKDKLRSMNHLALKVIGEEAPEQADGIIATVAIETKFLKKMIANNLGKPLFSVSDWVANRQDSSWVFLIVEEDALELSRPLLRLWFDLACISTLKRRPNDPGQDHLWIILDELKTLGFLPTLPGILDKGRKYKSSMVLGFQAISQLHSIYGPNDAASILQGLQSQFFFRMSEQKCAEYASTILGNEDVEQASFSASFGAKLGQDRDSISHSRTRRPVVLPEQLRNLPHLQAYAKIAHHHPVKMSFEPKQRQSTYTFDLTANKAVESPEKAVVEASLAVKPSPTLPFLKGG